MQIIYDLGSEERKGHLANRYSNNLLAMIVRMMIRKPFARLLDTVIMFDIMELN